MYRFILVLAVPFILNAQSLQIFSGKVLDKSSNSPLPNCNIYVPSIQKGTVSAEDGFFEILLMPGQHAVTFSYVGYKTLKKEIQVFDGQPLNLTVRLESSPVLEQEVTVTAKKEYSSTRVQRLDKAEIEKMPTMYDDVLRTIKILPGVTSNNELSSAYNVRGGNFNENLIYLNGYEIYRPFLLQKGVEENQSLINPDLTKTVDFYNGTFPAALGDKMSSAVKIDYGLEQNEKLGFVLRADLLNSGLSAFGKNGPITWAAGVRYSYPFILQNQLQTSGNYLPEFKDIQVLLNYKLSKTTNLEFFGVTAKNKYRLQPTQWIGHFRSDRGAEVNALTFDFEGENNYTFKTDLAGLKYIYNPDSTFGFTFTSSYYATREEEWKNQNSDIFFSPDANQLEYDKEYLKTRYEKSNNYIKMERIETGIDIQKVYSNHILRAGAKLQIISYGDKVDELIYEEGSDLLYDEPWERSRIKEHDLNSISGYVEDEISITDKLHASIGLRVSRYDYNDETLLSPRASFLYTLSNIHKFSFSWGYYYQSPFFYELKNKDPGDEYKLRSQRAIHYVVGWEYQFKERMKFQAEIYYKDLSNLIPFYVEQMKLEYLTENNSEGYAFGFDALFQGELDPGMQSWLGYSYLDTRERLIGETDYQRRILDQTHTIQIYIQDRIDRHPNWQSHLRLLFGSGYLFYNRKTFYDGNNDPYIGIDYNSRDEFLFYMRADMGLSATFDLGEGQEIVVMAEVMNVFNNYNFAGYEWVQAFKDYQHPIRIPQVFSKRFYNLKVTLRL